MHSTAEECKIHKGIPISLVCINKKCTTLPELCYICSETHPNHQLLTKEIFSKRLLLEFQENLRGIKFQLENIKFELSIPPIELLISFTKQYYYELKANILAIIDKEFKHKLRKLDEIRKENKIKSSALMKEKRKQLEKNFGAFQNKILSLVKEYEDGKLLIKNNLWKNLEFQMNLIDQEINILQEHQRAETEQNIKEVEKGMMEDISMDSETISMFIDEFNIKWSKKYYKNRNNIRNIRNSQIQKKFYDPKRNEGLSCIYCNKGIKKEETNYLKLNCSHILHYECIQHQITSPIQSICPECRIEIGEEELGIISDIRGASNKYQLPMKLLNRGHEISNNPIFCGECNNQIELSGHKIRNMDYVMFHCLCHFHRSCIAHLDLAPGNNCPVCPLKLTASDLNIILKIRNLKIIIPPDTRKEFNLNKIKSENRYERSKRAGSLGNWKANTYISDRCKQIPIEEEMKENAIDNSSVSVIGENEDYILTCCGHKFSLILLRNIILCILIDYPIILGEIDKHFQWMNCPSCEHPLSLQDLVNIMTLQKIHRHSERICSICSSKPAYRCGFNCNTHNTCELCLSKSYDKRILCKLCPLYHKKPLTINPYPVQITKLKVLPEYYKKMVSLGDIEKSLRVKGEGRMLHCAQCGIIITLQGVVPLKECGHYVCVAHIKANCCICNRCKTIRSVIYKICKCKIKQLRKFPIANNIQNYFVIGSHVFNQLNQKSFGSICPNCHECIMPDKLFTMFPDILEQNILSMKLKYIPVFPFDLLT